MIAERRAAPADRRRPLARRRPRRGRAGPQAGRRPDAPPPRPRRGRAQTRSTPNLDFYEPRRRTAARSRRRSTQRFSRAPAGLTRRSSRFGSPRASTSTTSPGTTAGGLHLATMGGVWQALAYGFAGAPSQWPAPHVSSRNCRQAWGALDRSACASAAASCGSGSSTSASWSKPSARFAVSVGASAPSYGASATYKLADTGWKAVRDDEGDRGESTTLRRRRLCSRPPEAARLFDARVEAVQFAKRDRARQRPLRTAGGGDLDVPRAAT